MTAESFTVAIVVDQTPAEAFAAINNVRGWWSGDIEGDTDKLNDVWTYRYKDVHYSKQKVTGLIPGKKVEWAVLDADLSFTKDRKEWNGTTISFDIAKKDNKTEVRFTHHGLNPARECYDGCSNAWTFYIRKSLKGLITTGKGEPNE